MIINILLSFFPLMASTVPVNPTEAPSILSPGGPTKDPGRQAPLSPLVEQPQPGFSQQPEPRPGFQPMSPTQHFAWSPLGGSQMLMPAQMNPYLPQYVSTLQQWPTVFLPQSYYPLQSPPYTNQLFSPYGYPRIFLQNQPPNTLTVPAGATPQPVQQQQSPQIMYVLQQILDLAAGSISSEDLEMAATMGQLAVLLPPVLTNPSVQTGNRAAGLIDTGRQEAPPAAASPSGVEAQTSGSGAPQPNNNRVPAGLELATRDVPTVQTPVGQTRSTLV
ncbi:uncharacterized protein LOC142898156 [Nelusetta ayraudi]|uniref:uncharacterized protein LOC142898156 n=1 Tax=Nelusetta ayraudi TaxID=303726 RepID=UPI003F7223C7